MFLLIFNQLIKMFLIMVLAYFCYKRGLINQAGSSGISNLLLLVVNPCLIFTVYQVDYDPALVRGLLVTFVLAALAHVIMIFFAHVLVSDKGNAEYAVERFALAYTNCGFFGIPLLNSVMGSEGVFYLSAFITVFNLLVWTHGLSLLTGSLSLKSVKKGLTSPMVICTILAMLLFFLRIRIPETLLDTLEYIADTNTPLAMMIAGFSLAQSDLRKIFLNRRIYLLSAVKLLVSPLAVLAVLVLLKNYVSTAVAYTVLIASACPTATTLTMMSIRYEKNYKYASEIFAFTTFCSVFTIPFVIYIADFFLM